jgi:flagellin
VGTTGLETLSIADVDGANLAIAQIDVALTLVNGVRGDLGAIQNRFESTIVNLQTVSENLSASRSRIMDADFAAETAALTKSQILQQAGVAVLAQANASPQVVLGLLQ